MKNREPEREKVHHLMICTTANKRKVPWLFHPEDRPVNQWFPLLFQQEGLHQVQQHPVQTSVTISFGKVLERQLKTSKHCSN